MSLLAMGCAFGMSLLIPSMPAFSAVSLVVPFLRMATMLNVILPLAFSCRVQSLLTALKSLRLPFCLYLPAAVMIRFIPTFLHDAKQVSETLRIRGWRMTPWNAFRHPVLLIRLVFTPLLFRSLKTSEELGHRRRTQGARLRRRDAPLPEAGLEGVRHMAFGRGLPCGGCGGAVPTCRGMGPAGRRDALMIRFERVTYTYPFQTCPGGFGYFVFGAARRTGAVHRGQRLRQVHADAPRQRPVPPLFSGDAGRPCPDRRRADGRPAHQRHCAGGRNALSRPRTAVFRPECRGRAGVRP